MNTRAQLASEARKRSITGILAFTAEDNSGRDGERQVKVSGYSSVTVVYVYVIPNISCLSDRKTKQS